MKMYPKEQVALKLTAALIIAKPELLEASDDKRDAVIQEAMELYDSVSNWIDRRFHPGQFSPEED